MSYMEYRLVIGEAIITPPCVIRVEDAAVIPMDEGNNDYQAYLAWAAEGNELLPFDIEVFNNGNN